jgi:hypothetical protein
VVECVTAGKRQFTLTADLISGFSGEQGRRGRKLPHGFQRVGVLAPVKEMVKMGRSSSILNQHASEIKIDPYLTGKIPCSLLQGILQ